MSPHHKLSKQACLLLFITMIQAEIHLFFKGEQNIAPFWSNFEITKCCGNLEYKSKVINILINSFLSSNNLSMQS